MFGGSAQCWCPINNIDFMSFPAIISLDRARFRDATVIGHSAKVAMDVQTTARVFSALDYTTRTRDEHKFHPADSLGQVKRATIDL
jgi:hypothetical protein